MAKTKGAAAADLTTVPDNDANDALATAGVDDFDFGPGGTDGLSEIDSDDIRIPVVTWNVKGKDPKTGATRQIDQFFDTLQETQFTKLRCVFLHLHKSNSFSRFDNDKNANVIHCSSHDRKIGRLRTRHPDLPQLVEGTERECEGCVDKDWHKDAKAKNVRNCDDVQSVFGIHLDEQNSLGEGFLIRFKRTGMPPWKTHLNKHHLGRRVLPNGQKANMPLWAYPLEMTLEVSENGNYATPVITRGERLPRELLAIVAEHAKQVMAFGADVTAAAEKQEARHEAAVDQTGGGSAGPSANDFADD